MKTNDIKVSTLDDDELRYLYNKLRKDVDNCKEIGQLEQLNIILNTIIVEQEERSNRNY